MMYQKIRIIEKPELSFIKKNKVITCCFLNSNQEHNYKYTALKGLKQYLAKNNENLAENLKMKQES